MQNEREEIRKKIYAAEDWLKEYELFLKENEEADKVGDAITKYVATGQRDPKQAFTSDHTSKLWKERNVEASAKIMKEQKVNSERELEKINDKIRDLGIN